MSQSSGYCGRLTNRTEWTRAHWENVASLVAWRESWLGVLEWQADWTGCPFLKRSSTWWAHRVIPHNHCRLDSSPEMGSSSDAAQRLALNYRLSIIIFFLFSWGRYCQGGELGTGVQAAAAPPPYMCGSWITSCTLLSSAADHAVFEPHLWSWKDRHQGARVVC